MTERSKRMFGLVGLIVLVLLAALRGTAMPARAESLPRRIVPRGFVTASGTGLVLDGKPYRFSGINVYNANSSGECWFAMNAGTGLDDALSAAGGNAMRAWFFQSLATVDGKRDWSAFDHTFAVARAHHVRVVVTLTDQWGACDAEGYKDVGWYRSRYRSKVATGLLSTYRAWVGEVVRRYRSSPDVLAWQLVNEAETRVTRASSACVPDGARVLRDFVADVGGEVKAIDRWHLLSVGTIGESECGVVGPEYQALHASPVVDLCEYHDYEHAALVPGDRWRGLQADLAFCRRLGKPMFVGEMGVSTKSPGLATSVGVRASVYDNKFRAERRVGVVGTMLWAWINRAEGGSKLPFYVIGPGDPALGVVQRWSR